MRNIQYEGNAFFIDRNGKIIDIGEYTHSEYLYYYIDNFFTPEEKEEYRNSNDNILMFAEEYDVIRGVIYLKEIEFDIIEEKYILIKRIEKYILDNMESLKGFNITIGIGGTYSAFSKTYFLTMKDFVKNDFNLESTMRNYKKFKR